MASGKMSSLCLILLCEAKWSIHFASYSQWSHLFSSFHMLLQALVTATCSFIISQTLCLLWIGHTYHIETKVCLIVFRSSSQYCNIYILLLHAYFSYDVLNDFLWGTYNHMYHRDSLHPHILISAHWNHFVTNVSHDDACWCSINLEKHFPHRSHSYRVVHVWITCAS